MVLILCNTPRRGVMAVVDCARPVDDKRFPVVENYEKFDSTNKVRKKRAEATAVNVENDEAKDYDNPNNLKQKKNRRRRKSKRTMTPSPTRGQTCFPFAVNCRFNKTFFGVPKKCGYCNKMAYGTGFACQNCNFHCHKKCVMIESGGENCDGGQQPILKQNPCSLSKIPIQANEESLVKELITQCELKCNAFAAQQHKDRRLHLGDQSSISDQSSSTALSPAISDSTAANSPQILQLARSPSTSTTPLPPPGTPHSDQGWNGLMQRLWHLMKIKCEKETVIYSNNTNNNTNGKTEMKNGETPNFDESQRPTTPQILRNGEILNYDSRLNANSCLSSKSETSKLKPLDIVFASRPGSNTCSPQVRTPVDDFNSLLYEDFFNNQQQKTGQQLQRKLQWLQHFVGDRGAYSEDCALRSNLTESIDFLKKQQQATQNSVKSPIENQTFEHCGCGTFPSTCEKCSGKPDSYDLTNCGLFSPIGRRKDTFSASWPLTGFHLNLDSDSSSNEDENSPTKDRHNDVESYDNISQKRDSRGSELGEWTIPFSDLEFGECLSETDLVKVYKGKWHGDVTIHRYHFEENFQNSKRTNEFLEQIRTFAKIRHENIALFMGASIELPLLAVVTSVRKGETLYDAVRCKRKRLSQPTKISIARQIAQGMGYLHDRGIVLKTLNSKAVFMESKVKISMVDSEEGWTPFTHRGNANYGLVRKGHLTYWSPELTRTLVVDPPYLNVDYTQATKESDVYAFGTVFYEILTGNYPFNRLSDESIIWHIGSGMKEQLNLAVIDCSNAIKNLIDLCWDASPSKRPYFAEMAKFLQQTCVLHKKSSSSMPDELDKTGKRNHHQNNGSAFHGRPIKFNA